MEEGSNGCRFGREGNRHLTTHIGGAWRQITLDAVPYCLLCFSSAHQTSACTFIKNVDLFSSIRNTYYKSNQEGILDRRLTGLRNPKSQQSHKGQSNTPKASYLSITTDIFLLGQSEKKTKKRESTRVRSYRWSQLTHIRVSYSTSGDRRKSEEHQ